MGHSRDQEPGAGHALEVHPRAGMEGRQAVWARPAVAREGEERHHGVRQGTADSPTVWAERNGGGGGSGAQRSGRQWVGGAPAVLGSNGRDWDLGDVGNAEVRTTVRRRWQGSWHCSVCSTTNPAGGPFVTCEVCKVFRCASCRDAAHHGRRGDTGRPACETCAAETATLADEWAQPRSGRAVLAMGMRLVSSDGLHIGESGWRVWRGGSWEGRHIRTGLIDTSARPVMVAAGNAVLMDTGRSCVRLSRQQVGLVMDRQCDCVTDVLVGLADLNGCWQGEAYACCARAAATGGDKGCDYFVWIRYAGRPVVLEVHPCEGMWPGVDWIDAWCARLGTGGAEIMHPGHRAGWFGPRRRPVDIGDTRIRWESCGQDREYAP